MAGTAEERHNTSGILGMYERCKQRQEREKLEAEKEEIIREMKNIHHFERVKLSKPFK